MRLLAERFRALFCGLIPRPVLAPLLVLGIFHSRLCTDCADGFCPRQPETPEVIGNARSNTRKIFKTQWSSSYL
jgi:hypothetical protein